MPTTEIAIFPFKSDANPGNPDTHAARVVKSTFDTLRQQDGMQQIHFGMQIEKPTLFEIFIDWDNRQKHVDFMQSSTYQTFLTDFTQLCDGEGSMHHVDFQPAGALKKTFSAPVTEVATFYFDGAPPSGYIDEVIKLGKVLEEKADGFLGIAIGITHEEIEREGVRGKASVASIGWESVEKHMAFRTTPEFKDNIHLLRSNAKKIEMHHVAIMEAKE